MHVNLNQRRACLFAAGLGLAGLPYRVQAQAASTRTLILRDAARQRDVPVLIRIPAGNGPWPVVLYSHGLGDTRQAGELWGDAWRAQGIAVVHLQHPGSDMEVLREGGPQALRDAASPEQLLARLRDVRFVMDEVARAPSRKDSPLAALRIDALGVAGHGFGAQAVQALAGQRLPDGADHSDGRPLAFLALSPTPAKAVGGSSPFAEVSRPVLAVTGSLDADPVSGARGGESRVAIYDSLPAGRRALLWLDGADHQTFSGNSPRRQAALAAAAAAAAAVAASDTAAVVSAAAPAASRRDSLASDREGKHHALVARLSAVWWKLHLSGDTSVIAALKAPAGLGPGDRWKAEG